jgi:hypothetical protein
MLEALRERRAELRESMSALAQALAAPAHDRIGAWVERVHVALVELSRDFREHIDITEGPDGLYGRVVTTAPRPSGAGARLAREHVQIKALIDSLSARVSGPETPKSVGRVRGLGTALLGRLVRHRQQGSDLIYEACQTDIGGET